MSVHAGPRRELLANTIAAWTWSQGTLVVSVATLPLMTRFLSKDEFGLWTQLLSLSALATIADMGMSAVFLRRITDDADVARSCVLRSATAFYRASSSILAATLLLVSLVPGGLLSPYLSHTKKPILTALLVIMAIGANLRCQPFALRLVSQGRMDIERIFGAGPAITGTLAYTAAAYWFGTAIAVAACYAAVEIAFDVSLVLVVRRRSSRHHSPHRHSPPRQHLPRWRLSRSRLSRSPGGSGARHAFRWGRMWHESSGVLVINLVPQVSLLIGITVVAHVAGPATAATYGLAWRVASLVPRFFSPFIDSLFVSLCRAGGGARPVVARLAAHLSVVVLGGGATVACIMVAVGTTGMRLVFGGGYGHGVWVILVLVLAATVRSMYQPFLRKIQSENDIGSLRYWFIASAAAQVPLAIVAATPWSAVGAAIAALACSAVFEAWPVARKLNGYQRSSATMGKFVLTQALAFIGVAASVTLLAWGRQFLDLAGIGLAIICAVAAGLLTLSQIMRYLAATRPVTSSSLAPEPRGQET